MPTALLRPQGHRTDQSALACGLLTDRQAEVVREERLARAGATRQLIDRAGPGVGEPSAEWRVAEQDVGHAGAFAARQPGHDDRVRQLERVPEDQWPAGDEHHDEPIGTIADTADRLEVGVRERRLRVVTDPLRIGLLPDDDDPDVRRLGPGILEPVRRGRT